MSEKILRAQAFAHASHDSIGQKRKYSGKPYWVHTDEVADIVSKTPGATEDMVCVSHLHDIIEDVFPLNPYYDIYLIAKEFGETVAKRVVELTDVYTKVAWPDLNRKQRHALENERLAKISTEAKTIKLADLINNTASIVAEDADFAKVYLREKFALLPLLKGGNEILWNRAHAQTIAGFVSLGLTVPAQP
jgi:guanosine-3',5'-bis(diphosphate) 3'-pyrophosphohydrolase